LFLFCEIVTEFLMRIPGHVNQRSGGM
jgi:hypothetical protein